MLVDFADERWIRAVQKAMGSGVQPTIEERCADGYVALVPSRTGDATYRVRVVRTPTHRTDIQCDCPAGQHGRPCWHAALVWLADAMQAAQP